jgi:mercuric ion transport protein
MSAQKLVSTTLKVGGMTCSHCNQSVDATFKRISGVVDAKADYTEGKAMVKYFEEKTEVEEILEAFNKLSHYKASVDNEESMA